jgi:penicillin amidase
MAPHSITTYQSIQGDNKYLFAGEILPSLANLKFNDAELTDARDWLLKWDGVCNIDSPHAALFDEFWDKLMNNIYQNKLGDVAKATGTDKEMRAVDLLLQNPTDPWWDDPATRDKVETRDEVLSRSFAEAYAATVATLGKDRSQWKWGTLHTAIFVSNPLGASGIGPIESLVNQGPIPVGGNTETVNDTYWYTGTGKFTTTIIATMRIIVDMGDLSNSVSMNSTGQSGHPGNPWYGNMIIPWSKAQYHPMLWTRQQVDSDTAHKLNLNP